MKTHDIQKKIPLEFLDFLCYTFSKCFYTTFTINYNEKKIVFVFSTIFHESKLSILLPKNVGLGRLRKKVVMFSSMDKINISR